MCSFAATVAQRGSARHAEPRARRGGDLQIALGDGVRVRIVVHAHQPLGDRHDVVDVVAVARRIVRGAAHPEVGGRADHREALARQPRGIAGRQIVLPLRQRDVAVDVDLRVRVLGGEVRRRLVARARRPPRDTCAPRKPFARALARAAGNVRARKSTSERAMSGCVSTSAGNIQVSESQNTCP